MYNLSKVDLGPRKIWVVLEKEIELYEHTEFTSSSDSWQVLFINVEFLRIGHILFLTLRKIGFLHPLFSSSFFCCKFLEAFEVV